MAIPSSKIVYLSLAAVVGTFAALVATGCEAIGSGAEVFAGSCEGDSYAKDMDTGAADLETTFGATADGDDIIITIDNLDANCCPSPGADVTFSGSDIAVDFHDVTGDDACLCMCVTDFEIVIPDVGPGDYTIDLDHDGTDLDILEVTVPE